MRALRHGSSRGSNIIYASEVCDGPLTNADWIGGTTGGIELVNDENLCMKSNHKSNSLSHV